MLNTLLRHSDVPCESFADKTEPTSNRIRQPTRSCGNCHRYSPKTQDYLATTDGNQTQLHPGTNQQVSRRASQSGSGKVSWLSRATNSVVRSARMRLLPAGKLWLVFILITVIFAEHSHYSQSRQDWRCLPPAHVQAELSADPSLTNPPPTIPGSFS